MSRTFGHVWAHVGHMWDARYSHAFTGPHMYLTCEKFSPHVGKRVKLEEHMWDTCKHMLAAFEPHADSM